MKFRTIVEIEKTDICIKPCERILFVGSCFANNIGKRFEQEKFITTINPYGTMYNPASVLHTIQKNDKIFDMAVMTFGTNHVYIEKSTGKIVDNCKKRPQQLFIEKLLTIDESYLYMKEAIDNLIAINKDIKIILTLSPIRYAKYGFHNSQVSKATLLLAIDRIIKKYPLNTYYFPAYEIINDELRDYRFYQADMLHPNDQAIEYIWERLVDTMFSDEAKIFLEKWKPIKKALAHKPFDRESQEYKDFMIKTLYSVKELSKQYKGLNINDLL